MKKWRIITIIISVIVGVAIGIGFYNTGHRVEDAKNDPVVQEDYDYLKECISKVAETLNTEVIDDPNVKVYPPDFGKGTLHITARLLRNYDINDVKCTVEAQYDLVLDNEVKVDYDSVSYRSINNTVDILGVGKLLAIAIAALCAWIVYLLLYFLQSAIRKILKK